MYAEIRDETRLWWWLNQILVPGTLCGQYERIPAVQMHRPQKPAFLLLVFITPEHGKALVHAAACGQAEAST